MPLELPNLDDRTYTDLVQEGISLIPTQAPDWTNHNPADPGITLIEVFAYVTEMLLYRLNRVTDANKTVFLRLLNGPDWQPTRGLDDEIRDTVLRLRRTDRAVTRTDFEELTKAVNATRLATQQQVSRAHCLPRRNLELPRAIALRDEQPGHISVIIVPDRLPPAPPGGNAQLLPTDELRTAVQQYLEPRRLLTDRIHIVAPRYLSIKIRLTIYLQPGAQTVGERADEGVRFHVEDALRRFFDPQTWPFGRSIYVSEIYELLDNQPGVDYVLPTPDSSQQDQDEIVMSAGDGGLSDSSDRRLYVNTKLSAIALNPDELVDYQPDAALLQFLPAPLQF